MRIGVLFSTSNNVLYITGFCDDNSFSRTSEVEMLVDSKLITEKKKSKHVNVVFESILDHTYFKILEPLTDEHTK